MIERLLNEKVINETDIVSVNNDEVIIEVSYSNIKLNDVQNNVNTLLFRIEEFTLKPIGDKPYFAKELDNGEIKFKAIPSYLFFQALAKYENRKPDDEDLLFVYEGKLSKFIEPEF
jgi:hypothetical protein